MEQPGFFRSKELEKLHHDLLASSEKLRRFRKAETQKHFIAKRIEEEKAREKSLRKKLKKEKKDFDKLKGGSLKYIFHSILQNVESQREKEKQEWLAAQLQWEQCVDELTTLEKELQDTAKLLDDLHDVPAAYQDLFTSKEKALASLQSSKAILNKSEQIAEKTSHKKEISEAIGVGEQLNQQLQYAGEYLKKASGWGAWDLLGGGIIATAIKRGRMDQARDCMNNAQHLLNQYNKELSDVQAGSLELSRGGFSAFADYFFDGLIIDWLVQSSINKAYNGVADLYEKVSKVNAELAAKEQQADLELENLQTEYQSLVETTHC